MSLSKQAAPAVEKLLQSNEDQLYEALGQVTHAMSSDASVGSSFAPDLQEQGLEGVVPQFLIDYGKRIFARWNREAYQLVCGGDPQDAQDREELLNSLGVGPVAAGAALASLLVTSFGLSAAVAAVVAAIVTKRFFSPAYAEFCEVWRESLD